MNDWFKRSYRFSIVDKADTFTVDKSSGSDWSCIELVTNGEYRGRIELRSKNAAEGLQFMLGQLLRGDQ